MCHTMSGEFIGESMMEALNGAMEEGAEKLGEALEAGVEKLEEHLEELSKGGEEDKSEFAGADDVKINMEGTSGGVDEGMKSFVLALNIPHPVQFLEKLKSEGIDSLEMLKGMNDNDLKDIGLSIGQRITVRKALATIR